MCTVYTVHASHGIAFGKKTQRCDVCVLLLTKIDGFLGCVILVDCDMCFAHTFPN